MLLTPRQGKGNCSAELLLGALANKLGALYRYCMMQIPSQMMITRVGAPIWLAILVFCWCDPPTRTQANLFRLGLACRPCLLLVLLSSWPSSVTCDCLLMHLVGCPCLLRVRPPCCLRCCTWRYKNVRPSD